LPQVNGNSVANPGFRGLDRDGTACREEIPTLSFAGLDWGLPKIGAKLPVMANQMDDERELRRFGDAVLRHRRDVLHLNQVEVAMRGGPSTTTLSKIEAGLPPTPSQRTLRKLDEGLGWVAGSAYRLLHEGTPPEAAATRSETSKVAALPAIPRIEGGPLRRLLEIRRELDEVIEDLRSE
jgi:transcriptional regulator with XRE-family HTH domain